MVNIKATVSYDGSKYNGWQIQNNARSVQEEIQLALFKIHKKEILITGSGRTDKGVHALNQTFNFKSDLVLSEEDWKRAINANLSSYVYIKKIEFVTDDFHSRYCCTGKTYSYYLNEGEYNPIKNDYIYQLNKKLDVKAMQEAANLFVGEHDFKFFCSNNENEVKDFVKTIFSFDIEEKDDVIKFTVKGTGFLRYQVRMMVGNLIEIGLHRKDLNIIKDRLDAKEGTTTCYNAPSCGLYLEEVRY